MLKGRLAVGLSAWAAVGVVVGSGSTAMAAEVVVATDYMTSGFFVGPNFYRGNEAGSARSTNRATSTSIFGVAGENAYFNFDFNPGDYSGPVGSAVFRVEVVSSGFYGEDLTADAAEVSLHRLTADPLAAINPLFSSGPGSWLDFRNTQITASSIVSTSSVNGFGVFEWDVTALVNEWIANGSSNYAYAIGTSALLDPDADTAVAFINSSWTGLTDEVTARLVIVPAPGAAALLGFGGMVAFRRRRG